MTSNEAHKAKARWKKRPSVRWFPIPQHMGKVVMIHGEEKEGGEELGAMCDGYGKAQLFALVEGWMGNKPEGARARGVSGWGKRYKLAKGHNEESLAHAEEQQAAVASGKSGATFSVTSLASPFTVSNVFNSTVDGGGNGLDVTTSVKAEVDTLLQFGHIQPLKPKAYANLERVEGILKANQNEGEGDKFPFKGHIINTNTMSLKRENEETGETSPLSALPPKQRNKPPKERPLAEAVADSIARAWAEAAAEMGAAVAYEVQPC